LWAGSRKLSRDETLEAMGAADCTLTRAAYMARDGACLCQPSSRETPQSVPGRPAYESVILAFVTLLATHASPAYLLAKVAENGCDNVHDGAPKLLGTAMCSWSFPAARVGLVKLPVIVKCGSSPDLSWSVFASEKRPLRILTDGNSNDVFVVSGARPGQEVASKSVTKWEIVPFSTVKLIVKGSTKPV